MSNILVVGAGISGATVANCLSREPGNQITVIDCKNHIGGNCHDHRDENGIMIHDYGSHIFHTGDEEVWEFVSEFAEFNNYEHRVVAMIKGKEIPLPFNLESIRRSFPGTFSETLQKKLLSEFGYGAKIPIKDFMNQDDKDLKYLAEYIYEYVFLHYTEKQWGSDPNQIDGAVTARVPVHISEDDRYFQDARQGIPVNGYTSMISKMLDIPNISIKLNTYFSKGDSTCYDMIFYTGPVDELMDYSLGQLPYRSVNFQFETISREHYQSGAVVNYPNDYDFTRIHEYKYYLGDSSPNTVIAREYSEDFVIGKNDRYYPVPSERNTALYDKYLALAKEKYPNMYFLGRLGDYRYYDMDKAVKRALKLCRTLECCRI